MAHSPTVPHLLLAPQYLKKIERIQKEENPYIFQSADQTTGLIIDETFSTLIYGHGIHTKLIKHLPVALVPAMRVNIGTDHFEKFSIALDAVMTGTADNTPL